MQKVCWIGLGHMGLPMAKNLMKSGFEVHGFDLSTDARKAAEHAGVITHDTAVAAAEDASAVFTMLPKSDHVRAALTAPGVIEATRASAIIVDCSTISASEAVQLAATIDAAGRCFLDAPVSGGTPGAEQGTLTFMVGGAAESVADVTPYLKAMGSRIFHVGQVGCGQSAKTVNNMMLAMNMASVAEAAALGEHLGLDHSTLVEIVKVSSGDSWVLRNFYPVAGVVENAPANNNFVAGFSANLMRKDVGLALAAAADSPIDLGMTAEVARRLDRVIARGLAEHDFSVLGELARGRNDESQQHTVHTNE